MTGFFRFTRGWLPALILAVLACWGLPVSASADTEKILSFNSHVVIHQDATMTVTETITVRAAGDRIKRGIYREFPTKYTNRQGGAVQVRFEVQEVLRDGQVEPYHTEDASNGVRVYIGNADVFLEVGDYTYTLTYITDRQLGFFEDYDELYWNVTGNGWGFTIDRAAVVIEMPPGAKLVQSAGYTGPFGAQGQDFRQGQDSQGRVIFTTTRPLAPAEGLTVAVAWPKGLVKYPTTRDRLGYIYQDNASAFLGLFWLLVIGAYYLWAWVKVGRDPAKGTIIPLFEPPKGMSPAGVRFVSRMGFDHKAFAATVVNLAVKGRLTIAEQKKVFTLHQSTGDGAGLASVEKKMVGKLFAGSQSVKLVNSNHTRIGEALKELHKSLKQEYEKVYFFANAKYVIPGAILTVLALISVVLVSPSGLLAIFMAVWLSGWSVGVAVLAVMVYRAWKSAFGGGSYSGALGVSLFALPFFAGELFGLIMFSVSVSFPATLAFISTVIVNVVFYQLLKAPTMEGRRIMDQIEGFRMYLSVAEKERLGILYAVEKTPALFEKFLPYALALDVENQWTEQFENVLAKAGEEGYSPTWYSGRSWGTLGASGLASSLGTSLSGAISSSSTAPGSSSGSGGGGSSGGGGGGGGGGGW
jgi:uncharacterized membrane protein YgcG